MRPRLRTDVEIIRTSPTRYVLTDPQTGGRFTFSPAERQLLHLMDGQRADEDIRRDYAQRFGRKVSRRVLRDFVHQLERNGLLEAANGGPSAAGPDADAQTLPQHATPEERAARRLNRRLDLAVLLLGWMVHPLLLIPYLGLIAVGIVALVRNFDLYLYDMSRVAEQVPQWVLLPLSLAQTIVFMNLPRELAVAIACRRWGGWVRWFGVYWLNGLLPFFLCDTGDSIRRMSTTGRWTVLLTGAVIQSVLGALYTLMWLMNEPHTLPAIFGMLQILPWMVATFFHLNPFVRLDAYRLLCVLANEPRWWERAQAETDAWLHFHRSPEPLAQRERFWLRAYGLGSYAWIWLLRLAYVIGGTTWLILRMQGIGALVAVLALIVWYRKPIGRILMASSMTGSQIRSGGRWWIRWPVRLLVLAGILALGFVPYAHEVGGECSIAPAAEHGVRAQVSDEIVGVFVSEGDWVDAGARIAELSGREIVPTYDQRVAELAEAQADLDLLLAGSREEDIRMAEQEVELWRLRLEYAENELSREKDLFDKGQGNSEDLREKQIERDSASQLFQTSREKLQRVKEGARKEEIDGARARLEAARARLAAIEKQKALLSITTPISGNVVTQNVKQRVGQVVQPGELIATIQDTRKLRVLIDGDEMSTLAKPGQRVKVRFWGLDGELFEGAVVSVATAAADTEELNVEPVRSDREALIKTSSARPRESYRVRIVVELDRLDGRLRPGLTGQARIVIDDGLFWEALWRPIARYFKVAVWSWLP